MNNFLSTNYNEVQGKTDDFCEIYIEFAEEIEEQIVKIKMDCLLLESSKDVENSLNGIFRSIRSIKGLSGILEQKNIYELEL